MKEILLSGDNIKKSFHQGNKETTVLDGVSVNIYKGDFTIIMGASV